jgi:hypothetical protein
LREIFGLTDQPDASREAEIDRICHHYGAGQLLLGLFAEIGIECIRIRIVNTAGIEMKVLFASAAFLALGFILLIMQAVRLAVLRATAKE